MGTTTQAETAVPAADSLEPRSQTEKYIASLWSEIIGIEKVSRPDKFLDVGGNSLTLNVIINRIKLERGVSIAPQLFFDVDKSSVMDLARELDRLGADPTRSERATPVNGYT